MSPSKSSQVTLSYSAYKPVPPPKPLPGYSVAPSTLPQDSHLIAANGGHGFSPFLHDDNREPHRTSMHMPGGLPPLDHILVTDQGHFHTHSTKFPIATDTEKLLSTLRYSGRFSEGIENPALIHDMPTMAYSTPHKNFDGRSIQQDLSSPHYARMTAFETGEMVPSYNFNHANQSHNSPDVHRIQRKLYPVGSTIHSVPTETISTSRTAQEAARDQARHVTFQPQSALNEHAHMNGGIHNGDNLNDSNSGGYYIPQQLTNGAPSMRPNGHLANHYQTQLENRLNSECTEIPYTMSSQSPHKPNCAAKSSEVINSVTQPSNQSPRSMAPSVRPNGSIENKKDEKWGSLKLAGKKYSHFKNIFSNKFSKTEARPSENGAITLPPNVPKAMLNSQGTNTSESNSKDPPKAQTEPKIDSRMRGTQNGLNASFHKAVTHSSLRDSHEASSNKVEEFRVEVKYESKHVSSPSIMRNQSNFCPEQASGKDRISTMENIQAQRFQSEASFPRKSGSCGQLAQEQSWKQLQQQQKSGFPWSYKSSENISRALPSDHAYPEHNGGSSHHLPVVREGRPSGGSDSGRGTGGSGAERESKSHDTSLESGSSTRNQIQQGQSSGNESEWIDITELDMQQLSLNVNNSDRGEVFQRRGSEVCRRRDEDSTTPPLPLLSPDSSPKMSLKPFSKSKRHSHSFSSSAANKPDLLETTEQTNSSHLVSKNLQSQKIQASNISEMSSNRENIQRSISLLPSTQNWTPKSKSASNQDSHKERVSLPKSQPNSEPKIKMPSSIPYRIHGDIEDELTSTDAALDLNSVLDGATEATSDDELTSHGGEPDTYLIRKQLEGLEGMYSEVLKLLGGRAKPHGRRRLHGSLSSLPSSIASGRVGGGSRDRKARVLDDRLRRGGKETTTKTNHKRFQRLESHVVTLARSVAHLSSEMRTQHMMFQEIESIKSDLATMKSSGMGNHGALPRIIQDMPSPWNLAQVGANGLSNPGRVKKLTNFFGDEPPLVRLFLRKLGYEKYAGVFEQEKIGMLELPYLTEERLQKIGIPLGPRIRILQEAQGPIRREGNLSVYVV